VKQKKKKTILISVLIISLILGSVSFGILFSPKTPPPFQPNKLPNPPLPEKNSDCPFYDKQNNLITLTGEANFSRGPDLEFTKLKYLPRDFVVKC
jgi:hypothetical protein